MYPLGEVTPGRLGGLGRQWTSRGSAGGYCASAQSRLPWVPGRGDGANLGRPWGDFRSCRVDSQHMAGYGLSQGSPGVLHGLTNGCCCGIWGQGQ